MEKNYTDKEISRSVLYSLKPMEINTEFRESLTGYISRLAINHNVTQGTLFSKIITPLLHKEYLNRIANKGGNGFYDTSSGINGIGTLATDFIEVISKLTTRNDLSRLTLVSLSNILPTKGLIRSKKAWCPNCYFEANSEGLVVFEQLVWNINIVNYCLIHEIELETKCPYCHREMQPLSRKSKPGYCSYCDKWLGTLKKSTFKPTKDDLKIVEQVKNLILVSNTYQREQISDAFKHYVSNYFENNIIKAARYFGISKTTFRYWYNGQSIPTLSSLVLICIKLDITIPDFLERTSLPMSINYKEVQKYNQKENKRHDHVFIKKYLNQYINDDYKKSPKSLKSISEFIGCDRRLLYKKHPEESKRIVDIYTEHIKTKKLARQENAEIELTNAVKELENRSIYPSRRQVEKMINGPYLIKERDISQKWKNLIM